MRNMIQNVLFEVIEYHIIGGCIWLCLFVEYKNNDYKEQSIINDFDLYIMIMVNRCVKIVSKNQFRFLQFKKKMKKIDVRINHLFQ